MSNANQVQIPIIQTGDNVTQVQQNTNKVLRNIYNQVTSLISSTAQIQGIGDVILSPLNLIQFQNIHSDSWILANGQSSVGTKYQTLTGILTVPTISVAGTNAYIKVD